MKIVVNKHINADQRKVFTTASDFPNAEKVISGITKVEMLTGTTVSLSTRFREYRKMYGKETSEEMEVVEWDPPRKYVLVAESCGTKYRSEVLCERDDGGTKVTMVCGGEPLTWWAKILEFLFRPFVGGMKGMLEKDLDDLKRFVEKGGNSEHIQGAKGV